MKNNVFFGIGFRIIILFAIAILGTYIPEHSREFFNDEYVGKTEIVTSFDGTNYIKKRSGPDKEYDWGSRHYWYFVGIMILFILSAANVVIGSIKLVKKNYDTSKW